MGMILVHGEEEGQEEEAKERTRTDNNVRG